MRRSHSKLIAMVTSVCMILSMPWTAAVSAAPEEDIAYLYAPVYRDEQGDICGIDQEKGFMVDADDTDTEIPEGYEAYGIYVEDIDYTIDSDMKLPGSGIGITDDWFYMILNDAVITTDVEIAEVNRYNILLMHESLIQFKNVMMINIHGSGPELNQDTLYDDIIKYWESIGTAQYSYIFFNDPNGEGRFKDDLYAEDVVIMKGAFIGLEPYQSLYADRLMVGGGFYPDSDSHTYVGNYLLVNADSDFVPGYNSYFKVNSGSVIEGLEIDSPYLEKEDEVLRVSDKNDIAFLYDEEGWTTEVCTLFYNPGSGEEGRDLANIHVNGVMVDPEQLIRVKPSEKLEFELVPPEEFIKDDISPRINIERLTVDPEAENEFIVPHIDTDVDVNGDHTYFFEYTPEDNSQFNIYIAWNEVEEFWVELDQERQFVIEADSSPEGSIELSDVPSGIRYVNDPDESKHLFAVDKESVSTETPLILNLNFIPGERAWMRSLKITETEETEYGVFDPWGNNIENDARGLSGFIDNGDGTYSYALTVDSVPEYGYLNIRSEFARVSSGIRTDDTRGYTLYYSNDGENLLDPEHDDQGGLEIPMDRIEGDSALVRFIWEQSGEGETINGIYVEYFDEGAIKQKTLAPADIDTFEIDKSMMPCYIRLATGRENILFDGEFEIRFHWIDGERDAKVEGYDEKIVTDENIKYAFTAGQEIKITLNDRFDGSIGEVFDDRGDLIAELERAKVGGENVFAYTPAVDKPFAIDIYADEGAKAFDDFGPGEDQAIVEFGIRELDPDEPGGRIGFDRKVFTDYIEYENRTRVRIPADTSEFELTITPDNQFELYDNYDNIVTEGESLVYVESDDNWIYKLPVIDQWDNKCEVRFIGVPSLINDTDREIVVKLFDDGNVIVSETMQPWTKLPFDPETDNMFVSLKENNDDWVEGLRVHFEDDDHDSLIRFDSDGIIGLPYYGKTIRLNCLEGQKGYDNEYEFLWRGRDENCPVGIKDGNGDEVPLGEPVYILNDLPGHKFKLSGEASDLEKIIVLLEGNNREQAILTAGEDGYYVIPEEYFTGFSQEDPSFFDGFTVYLYEDQNALDWDKMWPENENEDFVEVYTNNNLISEYAYGIVNVVDGGSVKRIANFYDNTRIIYDKRQSGFDIVIDSNAEFKLLASGPSGEADVTSDAVFDAQSGKDIYTWNTDPRTYDRLNVIFYQRAIFEDVDHNRATVEYRFDEGEWVEFNHDDVLTPSGADTSITFKVTPKNDEVFNVLRIMCSDDTRNDEHIVSLSDDGTYTFVIEDWDYDYFTIRPDRTHSLPGEFSFEHRGEGDYSISSDAGFVEGTKYRIDALESDIDFTVSGDDVCGVMIMPNTGRGYIIGNGVGSYKITLDDIRKNYLGNGFDIVVYTSERDLKWDSVHAGDDEVEMEIRVDVLEEPWDMDDIGTLVTADENIVVVSTRDRVRLIMKSADYSSELKFRFDMKPGWYADVFADEVNVDADDNGYYTVDTMDVQNGACRIELYGSDKFFFVFNTDKSITYWYDGDQTTTYESDDGYVLLPDEKDSVTFTLNDNTGEDRVRGFYDITSGSETIVFLTDDGITITKKDGSWELHGFFAFFEDDVVNGEIMVEDYTNNENAMELITDKSFDFVPDTIYTRETAGVDTVSFKIADHETPGPVVYKLNTDSLQYFKVDPDDDGFFSVDFDMECGWELMFFDSDDEAVYELLYAHRGEADLYFTLGEDYMNDPGGEIAIARLRDDDSYAVLEDGSVHAVVAFDDEPSAVIGLLPDEDHYLQVLVGDTDITSQLETRTEDDKVWTLINISFDKNRDQDIFPVIDFLPKKDLADLTLGDIADQKYTGTEITPAISLKDGDYVLVSGKDFTSEYSSNVEAGEAKITVKGIGVYKGQLDVTFKILPKPTPTVVVTPTVAVKPTVTVTPAPTTEPTAKPTAKPTSEPTVKPTAAPTAKPTSEPKTEPTVTPASEPTVKPTTKPAVEPTVTPAVEPTTAPTVEPTDAPDSKDQIRAFVDRIYKYVLDREPEEEGANFWTDELYSFRRTGGEVGLGFIFSDEFTNRNLSDEDFVTVLYKTFFGRDPEPEGFSFWTDALKDGTLDRMAVAYGFVYSQEWADTCASYGIRSGGDIKTSVEIEPSDATYAFVERMYTTAMKRASDEEGAKFWANELSNFRFTGEQVGVMFFLSDEMKGFNLSNEEFVTRLYKTFMDREPEEGGFNFWVGYLNDGGTRESVVLGFTRSEEFVNKCIEARILPY